MGIHIPHVTISHCNIHFWIQCNHLFRYRHFSHVQPPEDESSLYSSDWKLLKCIFIQLVSMTECFCEKYPDKNNCKTLSTYNSGLSFGF